MKVAIAVFFSIFIFSGIALPCDAFRDIKYWAGANLHIASYNYKSQDAINLGFVKGSKKLKDLEISFQEAFTKYIKGNRPVYDLLDDYLDRVNKIVANSNDEDDGNDKRIRAHAQATSEFTAEYGHGAGSFYCTIRIKGDKFPVLYEILIGTGEEERSFRWLESYTYTSDLGYASPDKIFDELKLVITAKLKEIAEQPWWCNK